mgnify:CR=1 FL=1
MIPKEMASDLYNKFYDTSIHSNSVEVRHTVAKQSSIVCVKEIINQCRQQYQNTTSLHFYETEQFEYYKKVIAEIGKL